MAGGRCAGEDGDPGFQVAPLVDVVFVLMLFFMACAGQQLVEKELAVQLPSRQASPPREIVTPILIEIATSGEVRVQGHLIGSPGDRQLPALRGWLKDKLHRFGSGDPVIIRPAAATRHGRIMDVLDAATAAGAKQLTLS